MRMPIINDSTNLASLLSGVNCGKYLLSCRVMLVIISFLGFIIVIYQLWIINQSFWPNEYPWLNWMSLVMMIRMAVTIFSFLQSICQLKSILVSKSSSNLISNAIQNFSKIFNKIIFPAKYPPSSTALPMTFPPGLVTSSPSSSSPSSSFISSFLFSSC